LVDLRQTEPLLELRVFGSSDFTRGIIIAWICQIALFGAILLVPLYLQRVRGYGALNTGIYMLPQALASGLMMPIGGKLFDRIGARPLVFTGMSVITCSLYMLSRISITTNLSYIMICLGMLGGGMGLSMMSINTHVLQAAPKKLVTRVTPLTAAAQQVMVSFAVAGITGYLTSKITHHTANIVEMKNPLQAVTSAYGDTFLLTMCIAGAGVVLSLILRKPKNKTDELEDEEQMNPIMMME